MFCVRSKSTKLSCKHRRRHVRQCPVHPFARSRIFSIQFLYLLMLISADIVVRGTGEQRRHRRAAHERRDRRILPRRQWSGAKCEHRMPIYSLAIRWRHSAQMTATAPQANVIICRHCHRIERTEYVIVRLEMKAKNDEMIMNYQITNVRHLVDVEAQRRRSAL